MDEKTEVSPGRALQDMVTICAQQSLENATLLERCAELAKVLRDCEWALEPEFGGYCPSCGNRERHGHTPDCALDAALGKEENDGCNTT